MHINRGQASVRELFERPVDFVVAGRAEHSVHEAAHLLQGSRRNGQLYQPVR